MGALSAGGGGGGGAVANFPPEEGEEDEEAKLEGGKLGNFPLLPPLSPFCSSGKNVCESASKILPSQ